MEPIRIERVEAMRLVGLHAPMSFARPSMESLWRVLRPMASRIPHRASESFVSMRIFDPPVRGLPPPDASFDYWAAVEVTDVEGLPPSLDEHLVRGGPYAVFAYTGTPDGFGEAVRGIFEGWLPSSPYRLAEREHFEVLPPDYRPDDPGATEEIWIPIEPREHA